MDKCSTKDKKLPEDRKCAEDYSITQARWRRFTDVHVALISVFKMGFAGYDRTFTVPFLAARGNSSANSLVGLEPFSMTGLP